MDNLKLMLSAPLAEVLLQVGRALHESQLGMDSYSLEIDRRLADVKDEVGTALSAPWFHIPEVEIDVHVALEYYSRKATPNKAGSRELRAALMNSAYQGLFNFQMEAASRMRVTFRSVPDQA